MGWVCDDCGRARAFHAGTTPFSPFSFQRDTADKTCWDQRKEAHVDQSPFPRPESPCVSLRPLLFSPQMLLHRSNRAFRGAFETPPTGACVQPTRRPLAVKHAPMLGSAQKVPHGLAFLSGLGRHLYASSSPTLPGDDVPCQPYLTEVFPTFEGLLHASWVVELPLELMVN